MNSWLQKITTVLLLITILILPLYVIRWVYFDILPTTLLELSITLLGISYVLFKATNSFTFPSLSSKYILPIATLLVAFTVTMFTAQDSWSAFGIYRAYILQPLIVGYVTYDLLQQKIQFWNQPLEQWIRWSLMTSGLWLSVLGIIQALTGYLIVTEHQFGRAHGVFNNGNALALYLGPFLLLLVYKQLYKKVLWYEYIAFVVMGAAFFLTRSTGGVLAILITTAILIFQHRIKVHYAMLLTFITTFVGFLLFLLIISNFTPTVENPWNRPGGTAQVRLCVWEGTRNLLFENALLGSSLRGFQDQYSNNFITCDAEPLVYPHNIILNFWVEGGLLGVIGLVLLFSLIFLEPLTIYTTPFLYWYLHGLVDVPYFKNDLSVLFWIIVALWIYKNSVSTSQAAEIPEA